MKQVICLVFADRNTVAGDRRWQSVRVNETCDLLFLSYVNVLVKDDRIELHSRAVADRKDVMGVSQRYTTERS